MLTVYQFINQNQNEVFYRSESTRRNNLGIHPYFFICGYNYICPTYDTIRTRDKKSLLAIDCLILTQAIYETDDACTSRSK